MADPSLWGDALWGSSLWGDTGDYPGGIWGGTNWNRCVWGDPIDAGPTPTATESGGSTQGKRSERERRQIERIRYQLAKEVARRKARQLQSLTKQDAKREAKKAYKSVTRYYRDTELRHDPLFAAVARYSPNWEDFQGLLLPPERAVKFDQFARDVGALSVLFSWHYYIEFRRKSRDELVSLLLLL